MYSLYIQMGTLVDSALDYQKYVSTHGTYQLTRLIQQTGTQTVPVPNAGGAESIFEIPPKVINFAKSSLRFSVTPVAGGANNFNCFFTDGLPCIRQLQLYTRSGLYLVDINDLDRYSNMVLRREVPHEDLLNFDNINSANPTGLFEGLVESNILAASNFRLDSTAVAGQAGASSANTNYLEPLYYIYGGLNTATPVLNYCINMDIIKNSLLGLDKDLYFKGEILYLRIVWSPATKFYFVSPTASTGVLVPVAPTGAITISNLVFYLAVEINPEIENMIKSKCSSAEGLSLITPWIFYNKINLTSTIQNITTRYNRAHGMKLQKIYWALYNPVEQSATAFLHTNVAPTGLGAGAAPGATVTSFYTLLNNIRTSQYDYTCANLDDYLVQRTKLEGSCIFSSNEYYYNWVWVEDFTDDNPIYDKVNSEVPRENCTDGLDLTNEIKFDIYANINPNYNAAGNNGANHYIFAITQKLLTISPSRINLA